MLSSRFTRLALLTVLILSISAASFAGIAISITVAPPPLPVYVQPVCPEPGYLWTPGYWAWGDEGYYWVPGTWVPAPAVGLLWTPGYWGWDGGYYRWNQGYWGPHVGFYGGVNYGYGYGGMGFVGGEWRHGGFFYNSAVVNVNRTRITNVYVNRTVIVNNSTHVSYNGGQGGIRREPTPMERQAIHENHIQVTREQAQHESAAAQNRQSFAKYNGGRPSIAATARPGDFSSRAVVPARAAGGRVAPESLKASAHDMPPARSASVASRPGGSANPNSPSGASRNVPRPPNAYDRSSRTAPPMNRGDQRSASRPEVQRPGVQRPQSGNASRPERPDTNISRGQPQMRSNPSRPESRPSAPPRQQPQAARPNPPSHASAPPQHEERAKPNEHEKH